MANPKLLAPDNERWARVTLLCGGTDEFLLHAY